MASKMGKELWDLLIQASGKADELRDAISNELDEAESNEGDTSDLESHLDLVESIADNIEGAISGVTELFPNIDKE